MYDQIRDQLMETIKELHEEAVDVAQEHWNWHLRENALREPKEKGRLNVRVRLHKGRVGDLLAEFPLSQAGRAYYWWTVIWSCPRGHLLRQKDQEIRFILKPHRQRG